MRKLLTIACIFLLYSCNLLPDPDSLKVSDSTGVVINLNDHQHENSIDTIVADAKCTLLDGSEKAKLSGVQGIEKVVFENNTIYILDKQFASIKAYSESGNYLFDVGGTGLTSDKYLRIEDMVYNPARNTLWVLCNTPKKIIEYSLDGQFLRKINIKFFASALGFVNDNMRYYYVNQNKSSQSKNKNLLITDSNNSVLGRQFDFPKDLNSMIDYTGGIYKTNGKLFFNPAYSNIYYLLGQNKIEKGYVVELGENSSSGPGAEVRPCLGKSFVETDEYVILTYQKEGISRTGIYNIKNGKTYTNDMRYSPINFLFNSKIISKDSNDLVLLVEPRYLQDVLKKNESILKERFPDINDKLIFKDSLVNHSGLALLRLKLKHY